MRKRNFLKLIVLSVFLVQPGNMIITPAIYNISQAFPEIPYSTILLVGTLPMLCYVPSSLIAGIVANRTGGYKALLISALTIFITAGIMPRYISSFQMILVFRALTGIANGIVMPLGTALIMKLFENAERDRMMGLGNVVASGAGMFFQVASGFAASFLWRYSFMIHGMGIFTLILVFFLPNLSKQNETQAAGKAIDGKLPLWAYLAPLGVFFSAIFMYPAIVNMSAIINQLGIGDAKDAGLVLMMFTAGGMLAGIVFAWLFSKLNLRILAVSFASLAAAMFCVAYGKTLVFMYTATFSAGLGVMTLMLTTLTVLGREIEPGKMAVVSGMVVAAMSLGNFVSSYIFLFISRFFENPLQEPYYFAMAIFTAGGITVLLKKTARKRVLSRADVM